MSTPLTLFAIAAVIATASAAEKTGDCTFIAAKTRATAERSSADPIELLNLVDREVSAHPDCACEIVKAAIVGTHCDEAMVGYIVETAVRAAPEHMRLISQCAIATAPDSLVRVQEVMSRLDPSAGKASRSAKSAKSAKNGKGLEVKPAVKPPPNPLDRPWIAIPPVPPIINPQVSTFTDFALFNFFK